MYSQEEAQAAAAQSEATWVENTDSFYIQHTSSAQDGTCAASGIDVEVFTTIYIDGDKAGNATATALKFVSVGNSGPLETQHEGEQ